MKGAILEGNFLDAIEWASACNVSQGGTLIGKSAYRSSCSYVFTVVKSCRRETQANLLASEECL